MVYIAGIDIGNATTETAVAKIAENGEIQFCGSGIAPTTGVKGTRDNVEGVAASLENALLPVGIPRSQISAIRINEASPVIGDFAMDTITETIITESTLIGHNPDTPGGLGLGTGTLIDLANLASAEKEEDYIVIIPGKWDFLDAAREINTAVDRGIAIKGAIAQRDDGVIIYNRLKNKIPIVDEVKLIEKVPEGMLCAVEVAATSHCIEQLSNPYGIATIFSLTAEETKRVVPIAKALIGTRSAVVIRTPAGEVKERRLPVGSITAFGKGQKKTIGLDMGSDKIMDSLLRIGNLENIKGEPGTNVGGMIENIRHTMAKMTQQQGEDVKIKDFLAVDTNVPKTVAGGLSNEFFKENAVGIAVMVKTERSFMDQVADKITETLGIETVVGGIEGNMAIRGALTTPGTGKPVAVVDIGAGSIDASCMDKEGNINSVHLAGAGNMVTMLINSELGLGSFSLAEDLKKYPLAKVESLFHVRHENGNVQFFEQNLGPELFARVVICKPEAFVPIPLRLPLETIKTVRQDAKRKVLVGNTIRALKMLSPTGNIREFDHVILVGGSFLDFEVAGMVTEALASYGIVSGKGNIRGVCGPRNSVATGLALSYQASSEHTIAVGRR